MSFFRGSTRQDRLISIIILFIGFQQFPVFRLGGSFKVYEISAIVLLIIALAKRDVLRGAQLSPFLAFVFAPTISMIFYLIFNIDLTFFHQQRFPSATNLRYHPVIATFVPWLYYFLCWISISQITKSAWVFSKIHSIMRSIIIIGALIGGYSVFFSLSSYFIGVQNPIHLLPGSLQNIAGANYKLRVAGFSQEPSFFVLYQGWILIFTIHFGKVFGKWAYITLVVLAFAALCMTLSSALGGFFLSLLIYTSIRGSIKQKLAMLTSFILGISLVFLLIQHFHLENIVRHALYEKVMNFFSMPTHTLDSGSFRAYTSALGMLIFKDYPLFGVGPGASIFFMPLYEPRIILVAIGESLNPGSFPQNLFVSTLSDLGAFGTVALSLFWLNTLNKLRKASIESDRVAPFYWGAIFTTFTFFSIAPGYSMFLWVFPALGLNLAHYSSGRNSFFAGKK